MAYTVDYTDTNKAAIVVNDGTVDTTTEVMALTSTPTEYIIDLSRKSAGIRRV